jgi:hypothetical protein
MSAAAVLIIHRRRRLLRLFRGAGATDRDHVVTLENIGERPSWIFDQMVKWGVFVPVSDDHYFLDEWAATTFWNRQTLCMLAVVAMVVLILLMALLYEFLT